MNLHSDRAAFELIIDEVANSSGVRRDVLEKDYYVTLMLKELADKPNQGYAYFKGGTALYKALRSIRRFSEDIDLTVYVEDCPTPRQAKKRLENASLKFNCLPKCETEENRRGSITCQYVYDSLYQLDENDALQRFGKVKVEATSFTVSEPTQGTEIAPHLYELCGEDRRKILMESYDVQPFIVQTISLERIFIDKVFAAEFYYVRNEYFDVAKHIYDLTVLMSNDKIKTFLADKDEVTRIVALKRKEELNRKGGVDASLAIKDFSYFDGLKDDKNFAVEFERMQRTYVLIQSNKIALSEAMEAIRDLRQLLSWL